MKVIGAGYSRTGTMTMSVALEQLGYHTYHMVEAVKNYSRGDLRQWNDYLEGRSAIDWRKFFASYDATMDLPTCLYYRELMAAFPDAKVILTVRDPESWWRSAERLVALHNTRVEKMKFLPRFREFQRLFRNLERRIGGGPLTRENSVPAFLRHNEEVQATVPSDRLLVFSVKEGWEPLCQFLGVPVPDKPFPHENAGVDTVDKIMRGLFMRDLLKLVLPIAAVALVACLLLRILVG